jgi:hypothetical protein
MVTIRVPSGTRKGRRQQETREFRAVRKDLLALAGLLGRVCQGAGAVTGRGTPRARGLVEATGSRRVGGGVAAVGGGVAAVGGGASPCQTGSVRGGTGGAPGLGG